MARTGRGLADEGEPLEPNPPADAEELVGALRHLEEAVTGIGWAEGIAIRYGGFYGPGTGLSGEPGRRLFEDLRRRRGSPGSPRVSPHTIVTFAHSGGEGISRTIRAGCFAGVHASLVAPSPALAGPIRLAGRTSALSLMIRCGSRQAISSKERHSRCCLVSVPPVQLTPP